MVQGFSLAPSVFCARAVFILTGCVNTKPTSLPEGGFAVWLAFGGLGLLCGCKAFADTSSVKITARGYLATFPHWGRLNYRLPLVWLGLLWWFGAVV